MQPGYPARYYKQRLRSWLWLICVPLLVLGSFAAGFAYVIAMGAGGILQVLGLGAVLWMMTSVVRAHIKAWREARIFPYYDKMLPKAETYLSGQALLRNCLHLDRLAKERGITSISDYGFPDALKGETVVWHDATKGLETVEGLIEAVSAKPADVDDSVAVLSELQKIREAFKRAAQEGIRFSFLIEDMGGTNAMVWEQRKGFI